VPDPAVQPASSLLPEPALNGPKRAWTSPGPADTRSTGPRGTTRRPPSASLAGPRTRGRCLRTSHATTLATSIPRGRPRDRGGRL